jgi:preprotein translocase SecE subunit
MAEDTDNQPQPEQLDKSGKRRLRVGNETVRERTAKFQKDAEKPARTNIFAAFWQGFSWLPRRAGRAISSLGRFRVLGIPGRFIGRILLPKYFRNSWRELRLVTWPDRGTSLRLTYAVIIFSVLFGIIIAIVDFVLDKLFKEFIIK